MLSKGIIFFAVSLAISVGLTPMVRWVAIREGWVAHPKSDRWHQTTTALMGGIAIFISIAVPIFFLADFVTLGRLLIKANGVGPEAVAAPLLMGATFLFCLGLLDDFRNLKPHTKLIGQIVAAALVSFLGFRLQWFNSLTLDTMATLFWIVGITNAFNLIDNMDGLCAGVGLVASLCLAMLYHATAPEPFQIALIIAGALSGFLVFNFKPAKIFMGDCGSLVIGFCLSVLPLCFVESRQVTGLASIAVPVLILLVPIVDTSLVTVIRLLSGRKASTGGRDHTSHRLVLMGFPERYAVLFLYAIGGISGVAAIFVSQSDSLTSPVVIIPMAVAMVLMGVYLSQLRVYPEKEFSTLRNRSFTPVLLDLTYKRHLLLVMLDFVLVAFAYYLSYRLRFEGYEFSHYFKIFLKSLPVIIGCKLAVFYFSGIYRGMWRYISTSDIVVYVRASLIGTVVSIAAATLIYRFDDFSKGLFLIDWILTSGFLLAARGSFRMFMETQNRRTLSGDNVVIYGAGRAGELLLREILNNKEINVKPIGFVDDDILKKGRNIQNFPILGSFDEINKLFEKQPFSGILVSFSPSMGSNKDAYNAAKTFCRDNNLYLKGFQLGLLDVALEE